MIRKLGILIFVLLCFSCSFDTLPNNLIFDSKVWKEAKTRNRGQMVADLEKSRILMDKTKPEVIEILGKPDTKGESLWIYEINMGELLNHQFNLFFDEKSEKVFLNYAAN